MRTVVIVIGFVAVAVGVVWLATHRRATEVATVADAPDEDAWDVSPGGDVRPRYGPTGRWRVARVPAEQYSADDRARLDQLQALPYLQGYKPAPASTGVTIHDPERVQMGYNLVNSGHAPEASLMDLDGTVLHTWRFGHAQAFSRVRSSLSTAYWRRVHLLPNGEILVIFDNVGIVKLNAASELVWKRRASAHHDLEVTDDGRIYFLRHNREMVMRGGIRAPAMPDNIAILDSSGIVVGDYSILECLENSEYRPLLALISAQPSSIHDIFHTNSIRVLDGSLEHISPMYKSGNVIVSLLRLDTIAIVDLELRRVVWASTGEDHGLWRRQHDPTLLNSTRSRI